MLGAGTPPCWSNGGGTGRPTARTAPTAYRADVLRFLDIDPATGKLAANGAHTVQLPDGSGLEALGASLVVIYRDPAAAERHRALRRRLHDGPATEACRRRLRVLRRRHRAK